MALGNSIMKTVNADYDMVVAQMTGLREDMAKLAHNVQTATLRQGHALGLDVSDRVSDAATYLVRKGRNAEVQMESAVAANPYVALGLAAGLGFLIGAMARR